MMTNSKDYSVLKAIAKHLAVFLVGAMIWLGVGPAIALASSSTAAIEATHNLLLARAASSRFAAQAEAEGVEPRISEKRFEEMRAKRRQWQSEASANADTEKSVDDSAGQVVKDRLNLEETPQENEIVDEMTTP